MYPNPAGEAFQIDGVWHQDYNVQDPVTGEVSVKRYMYNGSGWVEAKPKIDLTKNIPNTTSGINLRKNVVNLDKCLVNLSKNSGIDLGMHRARVAVIMDYSGSMRSQYTSGAVQRTLNRLVPLGLRFDDNGELDVWLFHNEAYRMNTGMNLSNYETYVDKVIKTSGVRFGGTSYAPAIIDVIKKYIREEPSDMPNFVIFITDGSNNDKRATDSAVRESSNHPVFVQFVGLGTDDDFAYLHKLDDLTGRSVDNTGFIEVADFDKMDDNKLYNELLSQYVDWLRVVGMH